MSDTFAQQVYEYLDEHPHADNTELYAQFDARTASVKSSVRKWKMVWGRNGGSFKRKYKNITLEMLESLVLKLVNQKPTQGQIATARLVVDILKFKRGDAGLEEELDPDAFLKKFTQGLGDGVGDSVHSEETDEDVLAEVTCIEKLECARKNG